MRCSAAGVLHQNLSSNKTSICFQGVHARQICLTFYMNFNGTLPQDVEINSIATDCGLQRAGLVPAWWFGSGRHLRYSSLSHGMHLIWAHTFMGCIYIGSHFFGMHLIFSASNMRSNFFKVPVCPMQPSLRHSPLLWSLTKQPNRRWKLSPM